MDLKNEKALMSIDGIIQSPLSFTPINTTLTSNGAHISTSRTIIQVAGISTIIPNDVVKINKSFIEDTGLKASLTPSRSNGFLNILLKMQSQANAFL